MLGKPAQHAANKTRKTFSNPAATCHSRIPGTNLSTATARLRPTEYRRICRLVSLIRERSDGLTDRQRFVMGLIGARIRKSGRDATISELDWQLLDAVESRLFDLEDEDPDELDL